MKGGREGGRDRRRFVIYIRNDTCRKHMPQTQTHSEDGNEDEVQKHENGPTRRLVLCDGLNGHKPETMRENRIGKERGRVRWT